MKFLNFLKEKMTVRDLEESACHILALDIGTEWVKAHICRVENGKGIVVGVGRQQQKLGDMFRGGIIDLEGVMVNVEEAVREAEIEAKVEASQIIMGIAGELVKGVTSTVEYTRENPNNKITMSELKNIVHKLQWKAFEEARKQLSWESGLLEIDVKLVHAGVTDARVDGYKISNPLEFKGKNVSLSIFNAFAPLVHFEALRNIALELDKDLLGIIVEPYAVSRCLGYEDGSDYSAIFIDIGGGTTDVAIVQHGGIVGTRMYGMGGRVFTKRLSKHMNISFKEAERLKLKYSSGSIDTEAKREMDHVIKTDVEVWRDGLILALEDFPQLEVLPSKILLCGGGVALPPIKAALEDSTWWKHLPFARQPVATFIKPEDVFTIEDTTGKLTSSQDITPMALANIAVNMAGKDRVIPRILAQVTRMMRT